MGWTSQDRNHIYELMKYIIPVLLQALLVASCVQAKIAGPVISEIGVAPPKGREARAASLQAKGTQPQRDKSSLTEGDLRDLIVRGARQIQTFMDGKNSVIPKKVFKDAKAVVYMESFSAGLLAAGFKTGRGFAVLLDKGRPVNKVPLFLRESSVGIGPQLGTKHINRVWLLMNDDTVAQLKDAKFKVGDDMGAVAGNSGKEQTEHFEGRHNYEKDDSGHPASYFYSTATGLSIGAQIEASRLKHWKQANAFVLKDEDSVRDLLYGPEGIGAKDFGYKLARCVQESFQSLGRGGSSWHTAHH